VALLVFDGVSQQSYTLEQLDAFVAGEERPTMSAGRVSDGRRELLVFVAPGQGGQFPGMPVSGMSSDQKALVQEVLQKLVEPYRQNDRDEALKCLAAQGGLDKCALAFYKEGDLGNDQVWDCWRLEGPSFIWYYRGFPHVHVWIHVADDPTTPVTSHFG
jgi:hypothetical protein